MGFMKYDGTAQAFELEVASMSFVMSEDKKRKQKIPHPKGQGIQSLVIQFTSRA